MPNSEAFDRRRFLGTSAAAITAAGVAAEASSTMAATTGPAASTRPAEPAPDRNAYGMLGKAKISRLMLGGNLVSGFMHARDLRYVSTLFRAYVTEEKIMETFKLAEENGINTVFESGAALVERYNKEHGGHLQIIPSIHPKVGMDEQKLKYEIKAKVDAGVPAMYVWGVAADALVQAGEVRLIAKAVELAKGHGIPVGVGGHSLKVPMACEQARIPCDFYVKTFHNDNYPSAVPKELRGDFLGGKGFYDNMWCLNPQATIEFMATVKKPWIAFKVLAAGAIEPRVGFSYAFHNGADFIAVGMFDFQIKDNCRLAERLVEREKNRPRPWYA
jgi:hypothetical protein